MDSATWGALALTLTLLLGGYTVWAFRHRGARAGARGAALTLLPPAAYLTGTLKMFTRIVDAVVDWLTRLAFTPTVWLGFGLLVLAVILFGVSGRLPSRSRTTTQDTPRATGPAQDRRRLGASPADRGSPAIDDDLADIEAILRKRGIS